MVYISYDYTLIMFEYRITLPKIHMPYRIDVPCRLLPPVTGTDSGGCPERF